MKTAAEKNKRAIGEAEVSFVWIQKKLRSSRSSDRFEELLTETDCCKWNASVPSETWRPAKTDIWEPHCGLSLSLKMYVYMGACGFDNKHAVETIQQSLLETSRVSHNIHSTNRTNVEIC